MARFRIPENYHNAFKILFKLDDERRGRLVDELRSVPIVFSLDDIRNKLQETLSIERNEIDEIFQLIFSLSYLRESLNLDVGAFVSEIVDALQKGEDEAFKLPENFDNQLQALLQIEDSPFYLKGKAVRLAVKGDKLLIGTRILTDVRPIFAEDVSCNLKANIILHNLNIEYIENGESKQIYVALDKDDLEKLKKDIGRAERKEKVLREEFEKTNTLIIDYTS